MKPALGPLLAHYSPYQAQLLVQILSVPTAVFAFLLWALEQACDIFVSDLAKMLLKDVQRLGLTHDLPAPFQSEGMDLKDD